MWPAAPSGGGETITRFQRVPKDLQEASEVPPTLISHQDRMKLLACAEEIPSSLSNVLFLVYTVLEPLQTTNISLAITQSTALAHSPPHCSLASRLTLSFTSCLLGPICGACVSPPEGLSPASSLHPKSLSVFSFSSHRALLEILEWPWSESSTGV